MILEYITDFRFQFGAKKRATFLLLLGIKGMEGVSLLCLLGGVSEQIIK